MKRYWAFYGDDYYPRGGMEDFIGSFDDRDDAIKAIKEAHTKNSPEDLNWSCSWGHVWDTHDDLEVWSKNYETINQ